MSTLLDNVTTMLRDNRGRRAWRWVVGVMASVVVAVSCFMLMNPAMALTGGTTLSSAITKDSALFFRDHGEGEDAWVKTDGSDALDGNSDLRLRLAFELPEGALKDGAALQYKLPDNVSLDTSSAAYDKIPVYAADTVSKGDETDAVVIGSANVKDGVLTIEFDAASVTKNVGRDATDAEAAVTAARLGAFVDLDFGFSALRTDADGLAHVRLNDVVSLDVKKASVPTAQLDQVVGAGAASDVAPSVADNGIGGDSDSATSAPSRVTKAPRRDSGNGLGTDLTPYITGDTRVEKLVNGTWTPATQFSDGDSVRVALSYNIPAGVVTETNRTISYQLPNGLKPDSVQNGRVTSGGKEVGDYAIDTDGKVTITYDQAFAQGGGAVQGTLNFHGMVSNTSGGSSGTINFGGASTPITVVTPVQDSHDITTKKTGSFANNDRTKASYTVTVTTNKGTGEPVSVTDKWDKYNSTSGVTYSYDQSSLKVVKVDANGGETTLVQGSWNPYNYNVTWTGGSDPQFTVSNLPALGAGEKYVITYATDIGGATSEAGKVANSAGSTSGPHNSWDWHSIEWTKDIRKYATTYDKNTGKVQWRIKVNPNHKDISGWRVVDSLPYPMTGGFKVWSEESDYTAEGGGAGGTYIDFTFPSNLTDAQKTASYYIGFWADVPSTDGETSNTAYLYPPDGKNQSDTGIVDIQHRTWDVSKSFGGETEKDGGLYRNTWSTNVTVPEGSLSTFEYVDTIENAQDGDGSDLGPDSHYALAADLEASLVDHLSLNVDGYNSYLYKGAGQKTYWNSYYESEREYTDKLKISVTYYDANGSEVPATDTTTHVKRFKVTVTPAVGQSIEAQNLKIDNYVTYTDASGAAEGSTWAIKNKGECQGKVSEATHEHKTPKKFDKQVYTGHKTASGTDAYASGDANVDYDDVNGILTYRLLLNTTKADEGNIVINDDLPSGQTLDESSIKAVFRDSADGGGEYSDNGGWGDQKSDLNGDQKLSYTTSTNADGTTHLQIKIPNYRYFNSRTLIAVTYKVSLADDPTWKDPKNASKTYTNTADWNGHYSTTNTKVTHDVKNISKTGEQLDKDGNPVKTDAAGNPTVAPSGTIRYYVDINPKADDLDPSSDTLELTDQLSNAGSYNPVLDISKVKLYAYDSSAEHHLGAEIDSSRYTLQYDVATSKITVSVPDSLACVLTYEYTLDQTFGGNTKIDNKASLNGKWSAEQNTVLKESSSSATAVKKAISIYKVDSDNYKKVLPGTEFKLEYWQNGGWVTKDETLTVDQDGKIRWDLAVAQPPLTTNTLYRLSETKALPGYKLDTTPHYFIWMDNGNNANSSYNASGAASANVQQSQVTIFRNVGGIMYIPNTYTRVTAKKVWANVSGAPVSAPEGASVQVQLYRQIQTADPSDSCTINIVSKGNETNPGYKPETHLQETVKKGTSVTLGMGNVWNGMTLDVYVNGALARSVTVDSNGRIDPPIVIDNITSDTEVVVQNTHDENNPVAKIADYTKPNNTLTNKEAVGSPITLNTNNQWSHDWDGLDSNDSAGHPYYYTIEEVGAPNGYTVSYSNNGGIKTGTITVTNSSSGFVLPKTGGVGTTAVRLIGASVAALALIGLVLVGTRRKLAAK
nr:Cna B-type domain-containing protein [uncultured Olsenella sp.]